MAVRAALGPAAPPRRQPEICWRARPPSHEERRGYRARGSGLAPTASIGPDTRVQGGAGPAAKPPSSGKSPLLLGLLWVGAECSVWGAGPRGVPWEWGSVRWRWRCWVRVMPWDGVGVQGHEAHPGAPRISGGPPWGWVGALGEQGPGWGGSVGAKVHVGHLRTSSGGGPWAEPRAVWAPQRYQARAWPGGLPRGRAPQDWASGCYLGGKWGPREP